MLQKVLYKINKVYYIIKYSNVSFGKNISFRKKFKISMSNNSKLIIGNGCFFNSYCSINVKKRIVIGNNCIFGENVKIYDHNHKFNKKNILFKEQGYSLGEIKIGDNCWIGSNVCILKGVTIGNNVVISAGCVINTNIPSDVIVKQNNTNLIEKINYKE